MSINTGDLPAFSFSLKNQIDLHEKTSYSYSDYRDLHRYVFL